MTEYIDHFYKLAVEASFGDDAGIVISFLTKLSNIHYG